VQEEDPPVLGTVSAVSAPVPARRGPLRRVLGRILRWTFRWSLRAALFCLFLVLLFRFVNPVRTPYMLAEAWRLGGIRADWTSLEGMAVSAPLAAAAAEDANFCAHWGFDLDAIGAALDDERRRRGGSTISQQVAKNVFLWQGRSWLRKGLEAGFTLLIELTWPKRRIVEVYLNVAETGEGTFGFPAAAQLYFGKDAARLTLREAALIAALLPNPKAWDAARPTEYLSRRASRIAAGAETLKADGRGACVNPEG
jgi:monofunctional biosynthetic peptidoglycan transglycosylase